MVAGEDIQPTLRVPSTYLARPPLGEVVGESGMVEVPPGGGVVTSEGGTTWGRRPPGGQRGELLCQTGDEVSRKIITAFGAMPILPSSKISMMPSEFERC